MVVYVYESRIIGNPNDIAITNDTADVEYGFGGNLMGSFSRNAAQITSKLTGPNETINDPTTANVNIGQGLPMSTTRNMFKFDFCEFDHMESDHLSSVSNASPENSKQKIVIKYQDVEDNKLIKDTIKKNLITMPNNSIYESIFKLPVFINMAFDVSEKLKITLQTR